MASPEELKLENMGVQAVSKFIVRNCKLWELILKEGMGHLVISDIGMCRAQGMTMANTIKYLKSNRPGYIPQDFSVANLEFWIRRYPEISQVWSIYSPEKIESLVANLFITRAHNGELSDAAMMRYIELRKPSFIQNSDVNLNVDVNNQYDKLTELLNEPCDTRTREDFE